VVRLIPDVTSDRRRLRRVEFVDVRGRQWSRSTTGSQIIRPDIRICAEELDFPPAPPMAFVAAIRLTIRELLPQPLEAAAQT
jgi:hypothetical protein